MVTEIISIGDELLIGQIVNTNASFIATELNLAGIIVKRIIMIGDTRDEILAALNHASEYAELVILTGGLGPTNDDITKNTLCEYFNSHLVLDQKSLDDITSLFEIRGFSVTERNRMQAELPHNCRIIRNPVGTAPGMWFKKNHVQYISIPGVPFEMKKMLLDEIMPELKKSSAPNAIFHKTVYTIGMGESALADRIKNWEEQLLGHIKLAYLPEPGIVKLRLSNYTSDIGNPEEQIETEIRKLQLLIPELIFGYNKDTIQEVVGRLLKENEKSVSTAESCTGGYVAHLFTSVPGSSNYYKGTIVAYDNSVKINCLGIDPNLIQLHGAVSEEVVTAMARQVKQFLNSDYAIATSGIAGPDGGTLDKPVGTTWIAIATPEKIFAQKFLFGLNRERNIRQAALHALNLLRKELIK
ncbi:MAG: competence/damage-inducible protein A [Bacteroidota bacterium]